MPKANEDAIKEVGNVPDEIKNLLTYEFHRRASNTTDYRFNQIFKQSNSELGMQSIGGRIVSYTYKIRKGRKLLREQPNNVGLKILVNIWSSKRLKYLIELNKFDKEKYKKLLNELEIDEPTLVIGGIRCQKITRKNELRRLTKEYCDNIIEGRLNAYHKKLKEEQKLFVQEKSKFEEWMNKQMEELKIDESLTKIE